MSDFKYQMFIQFIKAGSFCVCINKVEWYQSYQGTVKIRFDSGTDLVLNGSDASQFLAGITSLERVE